MMEASRRGPEGSATVPFGGGGAANTYQRKIDLHCGLASDRTAGGLFNVL